MILGAAAVLLWGAATRNEDILGPIVDVDMNQHRVNVALPEPNGRFVIQQTFTPARDGLGEIELLLVRREQLQGDGQFTLTLFDDAGQVVANQTVETGSLTHNQVHSFRFEPVRDSAERPFMLQISGTPDNPITVWGYSLDAYASGSLSMHPVLPETQAPVTIVQDIRLITRYRLTLGEAVQMLWGMIVAQGDLFLPALFFLPLPGVLLLLFVRRGLPRIDSVAWWGVALALGVALWPIVWFGLTLSGGQWTGRRLWVVLIGGWLMALGAARVTGQTARRKRQASRRRRAPTFLLPLLIFLLGFAVRLLAVRDVAFPLWVDAGRHGVITAVMRDTGQTISNYAPYLPIDRFPYHFGFHTLSAGLLIMQERPLPDLLLYLGQLLNGLVPLSVYAGTWLITRRRGVSNLAAFLVAIPFFFPAYYATWGRFTQLTGMLIMPVLVGMTWQLVRGARCRRHGWWLVGLLAAGLFLVHFRVFLIYVPFAAVVWVLSWGRNGRYLFAAGLLSIGLVGLRARQLAEQTPNLGGMLTFQIPGYNAFPTGYVEAGWERFFIWAAVLLLPLVLHGLWRRQQWAALPLILISWVGLLFLLLSGAYLGLPESSLINLNSMYITLFLPLAVFLAVGFDRLVMIIRRMPRLVQVGWAVGMGACGTAVLIFGLRQQITILNPQTILAQEADAAGLLWLADNVPQDAYVAVNSWKWLGNTYAGSDGGAWVVQLTGRQSSTPPADYIYSHDLFELVNGFNETAVTKTDWASPESAAWLKAQGITHIFVGAKGGFFEPAVLAANPALQLIYANDGVFIFSLL